MRRGRGRHRVALGGAGLAVVGLAASLALCAPPSPPTGAGRPVAAHAAAAPGGARLARALPPGLSASEHAALQRSGAYGPHPVHLLVLGDSVALTLGMGLSLGSQSAYGVTVADKATAGCDLDPHLEVFLSGVAGPATPGCEHWRALWPFLVASQLPQVVALGLGRWEVSDHRMNGRWVHVGEPAWDRHLGAELRAAIAIFRTFGARVVLFTMPYVDPASRQPNGMPWSENSPARARAFNALVRRVARSEPRDVSVLDLNRMLSPHGGYRASLRGVDVRPDGIHLSVAGGVLLQRRILPAVDRIGMEDETAAKAGV